MRRKSKSIWEAEDFITRALHDGNRKVHQKRYREKKKLVKKLLDREEVNRSEIDKIIDSLKSNENKDQ